MTILLRPPAAPRVHARRRDERLARPADAVVRVVFLSSYRGKTARAMWPTARAIGSAPVAAFAVRPLLPQMVPEATLVAAAVRARHRSLPMHDAILAAPELPDRPRLDAIAATIASRSELHRVPRDL